MSIKFRGITATGNIKFANTASGGSGSSDPHYASVIGLYNAEQPTVINAYDGQPAYSAPGVSVVPEAAHRGAGGYQILSGTGNGLLASVSGSPIGAANYQPITQSFTIEGWFKFASDNYSVFEQRAGTNTGAGWGFTKSYGTFKFATFDSGGGSFSFIELPAINQGVWFHLALCYRYTEPGYTGVGIRVFVNGIPTSAEVNGTALLSTAYHVMFNPVALNPVSGPHGYVDDIRITSGVSRYTTDFDPNQIPY